MDTNRAPTTIVTSRDIEVIIGGWLHAKSLKSGSEKTQEAYRQTILTFRDWLQQQGLDLDQQEHEAIATIAQIAQVYASFSARGRIVRPATINQRLAILSSFYDYWCADGRRRGLQRINPIEGIERGKVQAYASAQSLDQETVQDAFRSINLDTLAGKRNYALLAVLFYTGRRLQEVATLELQHLTMSKLGKITLSFEHCKGDKEMRDTLPISTSQALSRWLVAYYGEAIKLPGDTRPVWVSLANGGRNGRSYGQALGPQAIADVCLKYLDTSKVHVTRHTFAHFMEEIGAKTSEIQARLGHESIATTGGYLAQLRQDENKHGDKLAAMLGIE